MCTVNRQCAQWVERQSTQCVDRWSACLKLSGGEISMSHGNENRMVENKLTGHCKGIDFYSENMTDSSECFAEKSNRFSLIFK